MADVDKLVIAGEIGRQTALEYIEYTFEPGVMYALAGRNGAGKSTLLLTLAGELEPVSGEVTFGGTPPGDVTNAGNIVRVSDPIFLPDLSLGEHIELMQRKTKLDLSDALATWQLAELLPLPPAQLSSGQRQRAFLAIQLYLPTQVLLMDEPERYLDTHWQQCLTAELRKLAGAGRIVVVATHSADMLAACDHRIVVGHHG